MWQAATSSPSTYLPPHLAAEQSRLEAGLPGAVRGEHVDGRMTVGQGEEVGDVGGPQRAHP